MESKLKLLLKRDIRKSLNLLSTWCHWCLWESNGLFFFSRYFSFQMFLLQEKTPFISIWVFDRRDLNSISNCAQICQKSAKVGQLSHDILGEAPNELWLKSLLRIQSYEKAESEWERRKSFSPSFSIPSWDRRQEKSHSKRKGRRKMMWAQKIGLG